MNLKDLLGTAYKDGMTAEEIAEALKSVEPPKPDEAEMLKLKASLDKANAEAAENKRKLREKLSEDEKAAEAARETQEKLQASHDALLRRVTVADHVAQFRTLGYDAKLAQETAEALADGKLDVVFANGAKANEARDAALKAKLLDQAPPPGGRTGGQPTGKPGSTGGEKPLPPREAISGKISQLFAGGDGGK